MRAVCGTLVSSSLAALGTSAIVFLPSTIYSHPACAFSGPPPVRTTPLAPAGARQRNEDRQVGRQPASCGQRFRPSSGRSAAVPGTSTVSANGPVVGCAGIRQPHCQRRVRLSRDTVLILHGRQVKPHL